MSDKLTNKDASGWPVYLDWAATSATDPRVAELVMRVFVEDFGNAGSRTHVYGLNAQREVQLARERVGLPLRAAADEVIFTSGATESNNLAILGLAPHGLEQERRHIISTAIEHKAVLEPLDHLAKRGFEVTLISPDSAGYIDAKAVIQALRSDTLLVTVMHANNETGALQPIAEIADGLKTSEAYLHVDAAQTYGRATAVLANPRIDLISISGHKVFAPKGVGALVGRRRHGARPPLTPLMYGGGQEWGLRPGTLPVPLIAGLGLAAELAEREKESRLLACLNIRKQAIQTFSTLGARIHGDPLRGVLPNIFSVALPGLDSEAAMVAAKEMVAISNGSACTSAYYRPSHVLTAMGLEPDIVAGTIRMSWSHLTPPVPWNELALVLDQLRY